MMKRGQPYIGAFLLKDDNTDSDIITNINSVHHVGVFAQITSIFSATGGAAKEGDEGKDEGLTAVLYPHRRIKLTGLVSKVGEPVTATIEHVEEAANETETPSSPANQTHAEAGTLKEEITTQVIKPIPAGKATPPVFYFC